MACNMVIHLCDSRVKKKEVNAIKNKRIEGALNDNYNLMYRLFV